MLRATAGLGATPAGAVMVADPEIDVATARAAGAKVILVTYGCTQVPAAALGADRVVERVDALLTPAPIAAPGR